MIKKKFMTNKQKYRKAAEMLSNGTSSSGFCCHVLEYDIKINTSKFEKVFSPFRGAYSFFGDTQIAENQLTRSLALLFMAEMTND